MSRLFRRSRTGILAVAALSLTVSLPAAAQNWPQFYDPLVIRTLNLSLSAQDWGTVRNDQTFNVEVPAQLWLTGESPILVGLRRKSGVAIAKPGGGFDKVALKIDINQFTEQSWHGMKKLSLENGADTSTLLEGFSWYLHRLAWMPGGYPYRPGLASWARVYVNGEDYGIYVNVEQVDKRFLEWRGIWLSDDTWLYKQSDVGSPATIEFGPLTHSPTYTTLCYSPFPPNTCPTPSPVTVAQQLAELIEMQGMLTLGAVSAWSYSPDNLFSKGKNFYHSDSRYRKRLYFPWDLDANFGRMNSNTSIFDVGNSPYESVILTNPTFRAQYKSIMQGLLDGPFATSNLIAAVNSLEAALLSNLSTDPYNPQFASDFTELRSYITARNTSVASQLASDGTVSVPPMEDHAIGWAHPNPLWGTTSVEFHLARPGTVRIGVYDTRGARVRTLVDRELQAGTHRAVWEGMDEAGRAMPAGVYFVSCSAADGTAWSQKITLLR